MAPRRPVETMETKDSPEDTGDYVIVASKHPHGLHLDLRDMMEIEDDKGRKALVPKPGGRNERFTINGAAVAKGEMPEYPIVGGYALTEVPRAYWEEWYDKVGQHMDMCKKRLLFAWPKSADARAEAKEKATAESGLEGTDPEKPVETQQVRVTT